MVYIFGGIDFPLFEVLLVTSVLLLVGLVLMIISIRNILKELKQLRGLLKEEEVDIQRFERDIAKLERFEGEENQKSDAIKNHIKLNLQRGFKWEQIKSHLISQGWDAGLLDEIYREVKG